MKKPVFYSEIAWLIGICLVAWGTALTAWADFGISMVVAPAYVLHLAMANIWDWFSFGIGEYVLQAIVLILMMILLRKIKLQYFLSFVVAIFYGFILDLGMTVPPLLRRPPDAPHTENIRCYAWLPTRVTPR